VNRLVGITQRVVTEPRSGVRCDALDQRWAAFLAELGLVPVLLPNPRATALALAEAISPAGVILTGGNDLAAYGGDAPERDDAEAALVEWVDGRGLPVLGICRGAQHLTHLGGGLLERTKDHAGTRHRIMPSGREVNSFHDWAIVRAPSHADILASAANGDVEAFRRGNWTALMWHPEREAVPHPDDIALFQRQFGESLP